MNLRISFLILRKIHFYFASELVLVLNINAYAKFLNHEKNEKIFLLGAFALLSTTLFSCNAVEYDYVKKEIKTAKPTYADDEHGNVSPPPSLSKDE